MVRSHIEQICYLLCTNLKDWLLMKRNPLKIDLISFAVKRSQQ